IFDDLDRSLDGPADGPARAGLAAHIRALAGPALRRLGFAAADGEDDRTRELRATLLRVAAIGGDDPEAVAKARELRAAEVASPGSVDPSLAGAAGAVAVHHDEDGEAYQLGLARYGEAATPQEEVRELYTLARTRRPE